MVLNEAVPFIDHLALAFSKLVLELWWKCICRSEFLSLTSSLLPLRQYYHESHKIPFWVLCDIVLIEAVIWRLSIFPEKSFWSRFSTTLPTPCPKDALTDLIASSTLEITQFSFAVNTVSCTLVPTVVITLSISLRTLITLFFFKYMHIHLWTTNLSLVVCAIERNISITCVNSICDLGFMIAFSSHKISIRFA